MRDPARSLIAEMLCREEGRYCRPKTRAMRTKHEVFANYIGLNAIKKKTVGWLLWLWGGVGGLGVRVACKEDK